MTQKLKNALDFLDGLGELQCSRKSIFPAREGETIEDTVCRAMQSVLSEREGAALDVDVRLTVPDPGAYLGYAERQKVRHDELPDGHECKQFHLDQYYRYLPGSVSVEVRYVADRHSMEHRIRLLQLLVAGLRDELAKTPVACDA